MFNSEISQSQTGIIEQHSFWLKICLALIFLLATLIRWNEIRAPGYAITREYNSVIIARAFYFRDNEHIDGWRRNVAVAAKNQLPLLEPPVTEYLVSWIYRILGREEIWYARYLTSLFWLFGGVYFYRIVQKMISVEAAVLAVGYYLFVPLGIKISRSFQPDSLMMLLFLISLYAIVVFFEMPSWKNLILAGAVTGLTLLLRPLVLFMLFGAFIFMSLYKKEKWIDILDKHFIVFSFLSLAFPVVFYGYRLFVTGSLQGQANLSFRPHLLTRWEFWRGWFDVSTHAVGEAAVIAALLGLAILWKKPVRYLSIGLLIGNFIFGLVFNYHIYSHDYYHIQLFPLIGICSAAALLTIGNTLMSQIGRLWWLPVIASVAVALYYSYRDVRSAYYAGSFEDPKLAREIGDLIGHNSRTVLVAYQYGLPLEYYGEFSGTAWPSAIESPFFRRSMEQELSVQDRLNALGFNPEFFIITNFDLYNRKHQDLKAYLDEHCSIFAKTDLYLIYRSCKALIGSSHS